MTTKPAGISIPFKRQFFNVQDKEYGAKADSTSDDYARIQAALNDAIAARGTLFIPQAPVAGNYYKLSQGLVASAPVNIIGGGVTGTTLMGVGLSAGAKVLDFDCLAASNYEEITLERFTLRSDNGSPDALRLKNISQVATQSLRLYNVSKGLIIEGTRCYTHKHQINCVLIGAQGVRFESGFTGGGHFNFSGSTVTGPLGLVIPSTALVDALNIVDTNFEACSGTCIYVNGTVGAINISGGRTEANTGAVSDFLFAPTNAAEYIGGINIQGMVFSASNNSAAARIRIGGGSGKVRGFGINNNIVVHGGNVFGGYLVYLNGDGESGTISGNYLRGTNASGAAVVNTRRANVSVFNNENLDGKLGEYYNRGLLTLAYSASMTLDASLGSDFECAVSNTSAFTINAPTNPPLTGGTQELTITLRNGAGAAMGAVTWNAAFKIPALTYPANGFNRTYKFRWNGSNWNFIFQSASDVPN